MSDARATLYLAWLDRLALRPLEERESEPQEPVDTLKRSQLLSLREQMRYEVREVREVELLELEALELRTLKVTLSLCALTHTEALLSALTNPFRDTDPASLLEEVTNHITSQRNYWVSVGDQPRYVRLVPACPADSRGGPVVSLYSVSRLYDVPLRWRAGSGRARLDSRLLSLLVPMMFHVAEPAWRLGGRLVDVSDRGEDLLACSVLGPDRDAEIALAIVRTRLCSVIYLLGASNGAPEEQLRLLA